MVEELRSRVEGAAVTRRLVECDKTGQVDARGLAAEPVKARLPKPDLIIFGRSPVVLVAAGKALTVERLDQPAEVDVNVSADRVDFSDLGIALAPEGLYRFRAGDVSRVVRIDGFAEPGASPAVGRLVILR